MRWGAVGHAVGSIRWTSGGAFRRDPREGHCLALGGQKGCWLALPFCHDPGGGVCLTSGGQLGCWLNQKGSPIGSWRSLGGGEVLGPEPSSTQGG